MTTKGGLFVQDDLPRLTYPHRLNPGQRAYTPSFRTRDGGEGRAKQLERIFKWVAQGTICPYLLVTTVSMILLEDWKYSRFITYDIEKPFFCHVFGLHKVSASLRGNFVSRKKEKETSALSWSKARRTRRYCFSCDVYASRVLYTVASSAQANHRWRWNQSWCSLNYERRASTTDMHWILTEVGLVLTVFSGA